MRQKGTTFHEDSPSYLLQDEKPLTMKELSVAKLYDFDFKYGQKTAWDFNEDLAAIDRSMMQSPKRNRHRFKKRRKYPKFRFVPSLEDIQENEKFETQLENVKLKLSKDLATIHEERALGFGVSLQQEGRRYRHKKYSRNSTEGVAE